MISLQELGIKYKNDKHDIHHTFKGKSYLNVYEQYLHPLKEKKINLLEIGIRDGSSLRMWEEYFPNATVYGLDIDPNCHQISSERIKTFIGSQDDPEIIQKIAKEANYSFDIILDDGSHINELTLKSYDLLFHYLKNEGLYIMEDLGCSYLGDDLQRNIVIGGWPGMQYNKVELRNDRKIMNNFFNDIIEDIDTKGLCGVEFIHFYSKIAIIKKNVLQ